MGRVTTLGLTDFRCYSTAELTLAPGTTVVTGDNGQGKTSLLEALHWVATTKSFRGVPTRTLVRSGAESAIVRAEIDDDGRSQLVEAELRVAGRDRVRVNRQPLRRVRDLLGVIRVTVFAPDDLQLVKGGPAFRREYLDDLLVAIAPRYEAVRAELEKVLKHRNALLRRGMRGADDRTTLDVFDEQMVKAGAQLARGRLCLVADLLPELRREYHSLAGAHGKVDATYVAEWINGDVPDGADVDELLRTALGASRGREIERGMSLVGPHRDDWGLRLDGLDTRVHASQGEQRSLALALRLGGHRLVARTTDDEPVLLLDDVFSELDSDRARALVAHLPPAQTLLTTAVPPPSGIDSDARFRVRDGRIEHDA